MLFSRLLAFLAACQTVEALAQLSLSRMYENHLQQLTQLQHSLLSKVTSDTAGNDVVVPGETALPPGITQHVFEQKLNHFSPHDSRTFKMRYWKSERHYRKGGPIILLLSGEASGELRLPFLDYGILDILAKESGGMAVLLEHRYFGESLPFPDYSTKNMKWLTVELALEDVVHFAKNVDLGHGEMTNSPNSAWFTYGGSYPGAQSAFLRARNPDVFFGAFASSAVVFAKVDFWEFREPIRLKGGICSDRIIQLVDHVDAVLGSHDQAKIQALKNSFGLGPLKNDLDFVQVLQAPWGAWQSQSWDTPDSQNEWLSYCKVLDNGIARTDTAAKQFEKLLSNFISAISSSVKQQCPDIDGKNQIEACYGTGEISKENGDFSLKQTWRPWFYMTCTAIGYFMPAAPKEFPSMISRLYDLKAANYCHGPFDDLASAIPAMPNTTLYNKLGDRALDPRVDRLMLIDGDKDPWSYVTPHSPYALFREDTAQNPFKLMRGAVHRWDESSVPPGSDMVEPDSVKEIHRVQVQTLKRWLGQWYRMRSESE